MIDWTKILFDWRQANVPDSQNLSDWEEYHHDCTDKDRLVITAGDSWTYGDTLPDRLNQVYGRIVSNALNADWINIGSRGRSNSWILKSLQYLAPLVKDHYTEVIVIVTMTENGRDIETAYTFPCDFHSLYEQIGDCPDFYDALLDCAEQYWMQQLQDIQQSGCRIIVGHNFAWHNLNTMPGITVLRDSWIEKLADYQKKDRPIKTKLVTGWIFNAIETVHLMVPASPSVFKAWALPYIDLANQVNKWLDSSDLQTKATSSKHPIPLGHEIWADYILTNINN